MPGGTERGRRRAHFWLAVAGSVVAIAIALAMLDWRTLVESISRVSASGLALAALLSLVTNALLAVRWSVLAAPAGQKPLLHDAANALVAVLFNVFTPAAVGGDLYRVVTGASTGGRSRTLVLVMAERVISVAVYGVGYLAALLVATAPAQVFLAAAPLFVALFAAPVLLIVVAKTAAERAGLGDAGGRRWVATARATLGDLAWSRLLIAAGLSAAALGSWIACIAAIGADVGLQLGFAPLAMVSIATEFIRLLPISVQGIGVREAAFTWLSVQAGTAPEPAFAACAIAYALHFALIAVTALAALWLLGVDRPQGMR